MTNKVNLPFNLDEELSKATTMNDLMGQDKVIKKTLELYAEEIFNEEIEAHTR